MSEGLTTEVIHGYEIYPYPFFTDKINPTGDDEMVANELISIIHWIQSDEKMSLIYSHLNGIALSGSAIEFARSMKLRDRLTQCMGTIINLPNLSPEDLTLLAGDFVDVYTNQKREKDEDFHKALSGLSNLAKGFMQNIHASGGDINIDDLMGEELPFLPVFNAFKENVYAGLVDDATQAILSLRNISPELSQKLRDLGLDPTTFIHFAKDRIQEPRSLATMDKKRLAPFMESIINTMRTRLVIDHLLPNCPNEVMDIVRAKLLIPQINVLHSFADVYSIEAMCDIMLQESQRGIHYIYNTNDTPPYNDVLNYLNNGR